MAQMTAVARLVLQRKVTCSEAAMEGTKEDGGRRRRRKNTEFRYNNPQNFCSAGQFLKETNKHNMEILNTTNAVRLKAFSLKLRCEFRYITPKNFPLRAN